MDSATHSRVRLTDFQVYHEFADVWQRNRVRQIASSSIKSLYIQGLKTTSQDVYSQK